MAKVLRWGPGFSLFTIPLCVTPQLGMKCAYLSTEQCNHWSRKLVYELTGDAINTLYTRLVNIKNGPCSIFVKTRQIIPDKILEYLESVRNAGQTLFITVPLYNSKQRYLNGATIVNPPYNLVVDKFTFGSLYALHFTSGLQIYDALIPECNIFTLLPVPFKLYIDNVEVSPCTLCNYRQGDAKFCYLYNHGYSCLFHAGELPMIETELGNEQLSALISTNADIDEMISQLEEDMVTDTVRVVEAIRDDMWASSKEVEQYVMA